MPGNPRGYRIRMRRSRRFFGGPALPPPEACEPEPVPPPAKEMKPPVLHYMRSRRASVPVCLSQGGYISTTSHPAHVTCPKCLRALGRPA